MPENTASVSKQSRDNKNNAFRLSAAHSDETKY